MGGGAVSLGAATFLIVLFAVFGFWFVAQEEQPGDGEDE